MTKISAPLTKKAAAELEAGERILISGTVYAARDAAHKKMIELLSRGEELPFELENAVIYYMGPSPALPGTVIGAAGPTTSYRMDAYTPRLLDLGLMGMIGKGRRSDEVKAAAKRNGAVYFATVGGAGALLSRCIIGAETIAWGELGAEALVKLEIRDFPAIVVLDCQGRDWYELGVANGLS